MNREPSLDELIGADATGAERQRLQQVHELLLQAGPPPELTPELEAGPSIGLTLAKKRRAVKPRALALLAAALCLALVFFAGYAVSNNGGGTSKPVKALTLQGTAFAPQAEATLQVWHSSAGNWPMTLNVVGLPALPAHGAYEVYLVRDGRPWGACGTFRVKGSSDVVRVTLNAPYSLRPGDSWVVTRPVPGGPEPGKTVLRPAVRA